MSSLEIILFRSMISLSGWSICGLTIFLYPCFESSFSSLLFFIPSSISCCLFFLTSSVFFCLSSSFHFLHITFLCCLILLLLIFLPLFCLQLPLCFCVWHDTISVLGLIYFFFLFLLSIVFNFILKLKMKNYNKINKKLTKII